MIEEIIEWITGMIMYNFIMDTVMKYKENMKEIIRVTKVIIQSLSWFQLMMSFIIRMIVIITILMNGSMIKVRKTIWYKPCHNDDNDNSYHEFLHNFIIGYNIFLWTISWKTSWKWSWQWACNSSHDISPYRVKWSSW